MAWTLTSSLFYVFVAVSSTVLAVAAHLLQEGIRPIFMEEVRDQIAAGASILIIMTMNEPVTPSTNCWQTSTHTRSAATSSPTSNEPMWVYHVQGPTTNVMHRIFRLLSHSMQIWNERRPTRHAAALAYYSMFAFAPVLYVVIRVAGLLLSESVVTDTLNTVLGRMLGAEVAGYVAELVASTAATAVGGSLITTVISMVALLYAATGFFVHLQRTLNSIWGTHAHAQGTVRRFLVSRIIAFAMVIGLGALLVVVLFAGTVINLLQDMIGLGIRFQLGYTAVMFSLGTLTFAVVFRTLPAAYVRWDHCLIGGMVTTLLIGIGGTVMLVYLRISQAGTAFEAAGSLAVILIGVYYSAQLFLAGAVFTRALGE